MKIKVNINIFLFCILFVITNQIELYALSMLFALIHEIGHLLMGVFLSYEVETFRIMPLGFSIEFKEKIEKYNKKIFKSQKVVLDKMLIAMAGPITNLIIILILIIVKNSNLNLIYSNLIIMLFNLIPIYPLDGGRIILNLFKLFKENKKAYTYTNTISNVFIIILTIISSIAIYYYKNIAILLVLFTLWGLNIKENKRYNIYYKIYQTIDKQNDYL